MRSGVVPRASAHFLLIFLLRLLASLAWAQSLPATDDGALANAHQLFRQADFRGAAAAFRKIVEAKPSAEAYAGLVRSLLKADDVKAAEESSQKALAAFPDSAIIHAERGDVDYRRGFIHKLKTNIAQHSSWTTNALVHGWAREKLTMLIRATAKRKKTSAKPTSLIPRIATRFMSGPSAWPILKMSRHWSGIWLSSTMIRKRSGMSANTKTL